MRHEPLEEAAVTTHRAEMRPYMRLVRIRRDVQVEHYKRIPFPHSKRSSAAWYTLWGM